MTKKETAEQKLLRIIEEGAKDSGQPVGHITASSATASAKAKEIAQAVRGPSFEMPSANINISGLFSQIKLLLPLGKPLGIPQVNVVLIIFIILSIFSLIQTYRNESRILQQPFDFSIEQDILSGRFTESVMPKYDDINQFLDIISQRNIFRPYERKVDDPTLLAAVDAPRIGRKLEEFRLVGISWLDSPETASVMIEQLETGVTYFLRQGESFNELKVQKIYADRVIFGYQNEEMEVRL